MVKRVRIYNGEMGSSNPTPAIYSENYKSLMKERKKTQTDGKIYTMFVDWKNQYYQNDYTI